MRARRQSTLPVSWALAVLASIAFAPAALAAATATTGGVTNPTPTFATLNGTVTASNDGTNWFFEYGTSPGYGRMTATQQVSSGTTPVAAQITGLMPGTTYHYRLVVNGGDYSPDTPGADQTFTTPASPGTIATTGQATSITATSAELNGVANPSEDGATWQFQYGTSSAYGHSTTMTSTGTGLDLVSAKVTGLKPNKTYHFRLVVKQPAPATVTSNGNDSTFRTGSAFGTARLRHHHLKVRHNRAQVPFRCTGIAGAPCRAKVSLSVKRGSGKHAHSVGCGSARLATAATHDRIVRIKLRKACSALLAKARHHSLGARLRAAFGSQQRPLSTGVRLVAP
jgi:hypothetical protein